MKPEPGSLVELAALAVAVACVVVTFADEASVAEVAGG